MEQRVTLPLERNLAVNRQSQNSLKMTQTLDYNNIQFQRRNNQRVNRKLSRINIDSVVTPIWQQKVFTPSSTIASRFTPQKETKEYTRPAIELEDRDVPMGTGITPPPSSPPPSSPPPSNSDDGNSSFKTINKKISTDSSSTKQTQTANVPADIAASVTQTLHMEEKQPVQPPTAPKPQPKTINTSNQSVPSTTPTTSPITPQRQQELNEHLGQIETLSADTEALSESLASITAIRDQVKQQEKQLSEIAVKQSSESDVDLKTKQALIDNLEHALINTQNEIAHLESQPYANPDAINQLKEQLTKQQQRFNELKHEYKITQQKYSQFTIPATTSAAPINNQLQINTTLSAAPPKQTTPAPAAPPAPAATPTPTSIKMPTITTQPNAINGIVVDENNKLVENAVVIIKNSDGRPLRALKTNKLGQFWITTPLDNGIYVIETEYNNLRFDTIEVELNGEVLTPTLVHPN